MAEAAQVAGESMLRSRVGPCDHAARQWKVTPGMRLHVPTVPLCASPEASVRPHTHSTPSCSTKIFGPAAGWGLRRFLIGNGNYLLHPTLAARRSSASSSAAAGAVLYSNVKSSEGKEPAF